MYSAALQAFAQLGIGKHRRMYVLEVAYHKAGRGSLYLFQFFVCFWIDDF